MRALIDLQKKLYPDLLHAIEQRYTILNSVRLLGPVGRRGLAVQTALTERIIRSEVEFLQKQKFLDITSKGMLVTEAGIVLLDQLAPFIKEMNGVSVLEEQLRKMTQVKRVVIVPGNSDTNPLVKQEMGKACVHFLKSWLQKDQTIAMTGGTTMAAIAKMMVPIMEDDSCLFVPARGGIGEKVENEANTIVAEMARKAHGNYRMLYVPDPLSELSYQSIINEPAVEEVLQLIRSADVVIHGIGDALTMAKRRRTSNDTVHKLIKHQAVSEAFGYYFNQTGDIVHKVRTIGIQLEDLAHVPHTITVAGGKSKAQAIISYFKQGKSELLITDEAAASQIVEGHSL